jgi:hypothetical protein
MGYYKANLEPRISYLFVSGLYFLLAEVGCFVGPGDGAAPVSGAPRHAAGTPINIDGGADF